MQAISDTYVRHGAVSKSLTTAIDSYLARFLRLLTSWHCREVRARNGTTSRSSGKTHVAQHQKKGGCNNVLCAPVHCPRFIIKASSASSARIEEFQRTTAFMHALPDTLKALAYPNLGAFDHASVAAGC